LDPRDSSNPEPLLRIGPGQRLDRAALLIDAVTRAGAPAVRLSRWNDVAELLACGPRDRVVLDADHLELEDIGIVRRFLAARPQAAVEAVGTDRTQPAGRALLALPRTRWHPWPLELVHVDALVAGPPALPARGEPALPGRLEPERVNGAGHALARPAEDWRAPLSDLVGQVRRAQATLSSLRSNGALDPVAGEALTGEILRVERTVRSLALGSDALAHEPEDLDHDALVEEELAVQALNSRRAPRLRYHGGEPLLVRADRSTLVHSLGVLLDVVRALAGAGEQLEVHSLSSSADATRPKDLALPAAGPPRRRLAIVRLRAPAGALADANPSAAFQPEGLGERLPGIGASELHVLARLCASRGMDLTARAVPGAPPQVEFDLALPLAEQGARPDARVAGRPDTRIDARLDS
jgi:hypothetical protein